MILEVGKHFVKNHKRLDSVERIESVWAAAIVKGRDHIRLRLKNRTLYGAHTGARLGSDALDYYVSYAYEAILSGNWEWKDDYTLSEQIILIIDSTISTEVEKVVAAKKNELPQVISCPEFDDIFYNDSWTARVDTEAVNDAADRQVQIIEDAISGDADLEVFWECTKEGMKRRDIVSFMEKTPKQIDKLRERFIKRVQASTVLE